MNKPRLEKLIVALEGVDREDFDMKTFTRCGTPACVLGHYAARRDMQRTFHLAHGNVFADGEPCLTISDDILYHFGITADQARQLFNDDGCGNAQTPKQAQRYIRKFIDSNGE